MSSPNPDQTLARTAGAIEITETTDWATIYRMLGHVPLDEGFALGHGLSHWPDAPAGTVEGAETDGAA